CSVIPKIAYSDMLHQHQVTPLLTLRYLQYLCELTQQRIAQNVIQVYFFCVHYPGNKRYNTVADILDCNNVRGLYNMVKDAADWLTQTSRYQRKLVRPSPVKALLNTRVLSGETHLKVGFVISGVW
ncbi:hypothetical protein ACJ8PV_27220, partial [Serratia sp. CY83726]|uniref:hypothetical protein n=1 Tax=Serratia sp. CY83726 TaxID=3383691 RepID=UPI003FA05458